MKKLHVTAEADDDVFGIFLFVSKHDLDAAQKLVNKLFAAFHRLTQFPEMGRPRPELERTMRSLVEGKYLILYRNLPETIEVVRILHTSQDIKRAFGDE